MSKQGIEHATHVDKYPKSRLDAVVYTEAQILDRVRELGEEIAKDYYPLYLADKESFSLILVGVLKGCSPFVADLSRQIYRCLCELHKAIFSPMCGEFIAIESKGPNNEQKPLKWLLDTRMSLANAHVLIVEDIIDSGKTIRAIISKLMPSDSEVEGPTSLEVCTFMDRVSASKVARAKYTGFELNGDDWVVGYGLDSHELGRFLPDIWTLDKL